MESTKNGCCLRVHSIRKWFRAELTALGVQPEYSEYLLGHRSSPYHDIRSKGVEFLRDIYNRADLRISKQPREAEYRRKFTAQILREALASTRKSIFYKDRPAQNHTESMQERETTRTMSYQ